jgi:hypothetical protein
MMGPDTIIARTILLDEGKNFKPAAEIYDKAKMGVGAGVRVDPLIPHLRLKSKSVVLRKRDSRP